MRGEKINIVMQKVLGVVRGLAVSMRSEVCRGGMLLMSAAMLLTRTRRGASWLLSLSGRICLTAALLLGLSACDRTIHEYPDAGSGIVLHLTCDTDIPLYKEVTVTKADDISSFRHIVKIFGMDDGTVSSTEVLSIEEADTELDKSLTVDLKVGDYRIEVWTDHGAVYDASAFTGVLMDVTSADDYQMKEAWHGSVDVTIDANSTGKVIEIPCSMPMSKIQFIATDFEDYIAKARAGETRSDDIEDYYAIIRYTGYYPMKFNLFYDRVTDAALGVSTVGSPERTTNQEIMVASDYILINESDTTIPAQLEIYSSGGELISTSSTIEIPIRRGHLTIIRGSFFSAQSSGNIGINPDYDGEYNIEIK